MNRKNLFQQILFGLMGTAMIALPASAQLTGAVKITGGSVLGVPGNDPAITAFKGLPFAAPPVGDLRWRAPQAVVPWEGVRKADRISNSCIQNEVYERKPWTHEFMAHNDISEDCLYLNVWTPAKTSNDKLAVYFFIYGGGGVEGSTAVPVYDGEGLAKKGIIVVTANYRLGIFASLVHPELSAEAPYHASGNYSILDLVAALEWVKQNISKFGGDPDKVTIGGQSAGSGNVFSLTVTPLARGLFRGAINESGATATVFAAHGQSLAQEEKEGEAFAAAKGAKSIAELRRLSWQQIMEPIPAAAPGEKPPTFRFGTVIDGYVFPLSALETYLQGKQNDVPTLMGYNLNDNTGPAPHPDTTLADFKKLAKSLYGDSSDEFLTLYPASTDDEAKSAYMHATWDRVRSSVYYWAMWRARTARTGFYSYFWDHTLPGPDSDRFGVFHTSEVPYVLNSIAKSDRPFTEEDRKIADTLSTYWSNFVNTGNPNGPGLAHWPSTAEAPGTTMEIGNKYQPIPITGDKQKQLFFEKYWNSPERLAR